MDLATRLRYMSNEDALEPDWTRLGVAVRRRRERLGLTQQEVAAKGGPSTATMRQIEGGLTDGYRAKTLYQLDEALDWERGTCIAIVERDSLGLLEAPDEWTERVIRDVRRQIAAGQDFPVGRPTDHVSQPVGLGLDDEAAELSPAQIEAVRAVIRGMKPQ